MKNSLFILALIFMSLPVVAQDEPEISQVNRYFIYFTDKSGDTYPYSTSSPEDFLTQRSIDRKEKYGISIIEEDLPVNPSYVQGLRDAGVDVYFSSRWLNGVLTHLDTVLLDELERLPYVDSIAWVADTTRLSRSRNVPENPTEFDEPPSVDGNSDIQLTMLGADYMHANDIKGQGMLIAILDNGFVGVNRYTPFQHLWENNRIIATKDFVQNSGNVFQFGSHGTSVFSIISSKYQSESNNLLGVAHEAEFILCITEDNSAENTLEEYNWLLGAEFADSLGADIINGSLGYRLFDIESHNYDFEDLDGQTTIVSRAAKMASDRGMIVAISAGNEGSKSWRRIISPADAKNVLTVGSVNPDFSYSSFSSVGPTADGRIKPDVVAFGSGTAIVRGNGSIRRGAGTSFSSPLIAGLAAGVWQSNRDRTSQEVIEMIKNSGHRAHAPDTLVGYGVPNYASAIGRALHVQDILDDKITVYPNPFRGNTLYLITEGVFKEEGMSIKILDQKGRVIFEKSYKKEDIKKIIELTVNSNEKGVYFLFLQTGNSQKIIKLINF